MTSTQSIHDLTQSVNLPGFFVVDTRYQSGEFYLYLQRRSHCAKCGKCGKFCGTFYDSSSRTIRDLDWGHNLVFLVIQRVRVQCPRCGIRAESLPFAPLGTRHTKRFSNAAARMCRSMTRRDAAQLFSLSEDTVGRYELTYVQHQQKIAKRERRTVRLLQFDEIAKRKGHNYVTVFQDCESRQVLDVVDGRKKEDVKRFFEAMTKEKCEGIEAVCIDMSTSYISAAKEYCPNAMLVFDRFHIVKHLNEALCKLAKSEKLKQPPEQQKHWERLSRIMGKNPENLTPKQRVQRDLVLSQSALLSTAYRLKEQFRGLWDKRTLRGAKISLTRWVSSARALGETPFLDFVAMVERHRREILNYYHFPLTNGPQEGLNNKLNVLRRRAYGFANVENYKLKIFQSTLEKERVFLP